MPTGWMVLAPDADVPVLLSGTAADLWEILGNPSTLGEIVDTLAATYAGDRGEIEADLRAALADLVARGIALEGP